MTRAAGKHPGARPLHSLPHGLGKGELALWVGAAAVVVAAHMAGGWYLQNMPAGEAPAIEAAPAIMMELTPLPTEPEAAPAGILEPAPEPVEEPAIEEPVIEETIEEPAEAPPPEPVEQSPSSEPAPEVLPDPVEQAVAEPDVAEPEQVVLPEVALMVPQPRPARGPPKPAPQKPEPQKPEQKRPEKKAEPQKPVARAASRPAAGAPAAAAPRAAQPAIGSGVSPARWHSRLTAHIRRHQRKPRGGAASGTAVVKFTVNAGGALVALSLARSSGNAALDAAALESVRRAAPMPAPPDGLPASAMTVMQPIRYAR